MTIYTIAFSSLIMLVISVTQLGLEYRDLRTSLDKELDGVEVFVPNLSGSVWSFDQKQIQLALNGVKRLPNIEYVRVLTANKSQEWVSGSMPRGNTLTRDFDLVAVVKGKDTVIGQMSVVASLDEINRHIVERAISIFLSNGLKSFLVALFSLFLFRHLVARRLDSVGASLRSLTPLVFPAAAHPQPPALAMPEHLDELDILEWTLNGTAKELKRASVELEQHRDHLETLVDERTQALSIAKQAAEAASGAKSEFLAHMSHEIRTPMNSVMGMTRLALRYATHPKQKEQMHKALASADHLLGVINDILDFSKIEAGKLTINNEPFVLDPLLEQLSDITAQRLQSKSVDLLFDVDSKLPRRLVGDALRLSQVLINLLSNSAKFTHAGNIVLRAQLLQQDETWLRVRFAVSDTGIGVSPEQLTKLFGSFTQADSSITRQYGGTGLGLAISKQLVELMGGHIDVSSALGQGTTFSFELLLGIDTAPQSADDGAAGLRCGRVLVVDDSQVACDIVAELVGPMSTGVSKALSGDEALKLMETAMPPFDLVITDYRMPEMDGIELSRRIRNHPRLNPLVPIVLVTGQDVDTLSETAGPDLVQAILAKPLNVSRLHNTLMDLGRGRRTAAGDGNAYRQGQLPELRPLHGARVLLVDDFELNREVAQGILAEARVWIDLAEDGQMAVNMVSTGSYDVVLMDIQMPVMDGLSATRAIRAMPQFAKLPIIAMTAHAMASDRETSLQAGMNDHIVKPIDPGQLFRMLLRWVDPAGLVARPVPDPVDTAASDESDQLMAQLPPVACIDWSAGLEKAQRSVPQYRRIVRNFRRDYAPAPQRLRAAVEAGVDDAIRIVAHNLKSSATYIGALNLARQAAALETACRTNEGDGIRHLLPQVADSLELVLEALTQAIAAIDPPRPESRAEMPTDTAAIAAEMRTLAGLLGDGDSRAEDTCERLQTLLPVALQAPGQRIRDLIDDIEYEQAQGALKSLAQTLSVSLDQD